MSRISGYSLRIAGLAFFAVIAGCGRTEQWVIEHHGAPCTGVGRFMCLLVQMESDGPFQFHHGAIEGFTYRDGHRQTIQVSRHAVLNPPQDGSSERLVLQKLVKSEPVDSEARFTLTLEPGDLSGDSSSGFLLLGQAIRFADDVARTASLARNAGSTDFRVEFQHDPTQEDRWVALGVR
jgi:hypothetical protein